VTYSAGQDEVSGAGAWVRITTRSDVVRIETGDRGFEERDTLVGGEEGDHSGLERR
jgi:hypothetical protein